MTNLKKSQLDCPFMIQHQQSHCRFSDSVYQTKKTKRPSFLSLEERRPIFEPSRTFISSKEKSSSAEAKHAARQSRCTVLYLAFNGSTRKKQLKRCTPGGVLKIIGKCFEKKLVVHSITYNYPVWMRCISMAYRFTCESTCTMLRHDKHILYRK